MARFNYAKHHEPNGVVLDTGDFVHLKPQGMAASASEIGDAVKAVGEARVMVFGNGVIEDTRINGNPIVRKHGPHQSPVAAGKQAMPSARSLRSFAWLNCFLVDVQTGVGPFWPYTWLTIGPSRAAVRRSPWAVSPDHHANSNWQLIDRLRAKRELIY